VLAAILLIAADDTDKKEQDRFQGQWETVGILLNGRDAHKEGVTFKTTFKGDRLTHEGDPETQKNYGEMTFKLDSKTNPKSIDFPVTAGERKGALLPGIYEFKGEGLRICVNLESNERPKRFAAPENENIVLLTYKRVKP
jgi:uncharacterized protein (TIGR03067 family)